MSLRHDHLTEVVFDVRVDRDGALAEPKEDAEEGLQNIRSRRQGRVERDPVVLSGRVENAPHLLRLVRMRNREVGQKPVVAPP